MNNLEGKVAIVTGASKGIGKGIALDLAQKGAKVVVNYVNSITDAQAVVKEITAKGGEAIAVKGDVSIITDVQNIIQTTLDKYHKIDVVVNNAGVYQFAPFEAITQEEFQREFNINVWGTINMIQNTVPHLEKNGGSIINISSIATERPSPYTSLYTATKASVDAITKVLSKELGSRNIRINAVLPGLTETNGTHSIGVIGSEQQAHMVSLTPLGRISQPEDIAKIVSFLASDESYWMTGECVGVSGGL